MTRQTEWRPYILSFIITAAIFATAFYLSSYFSERRLSEIRSIEDKLSTDILSLETQFQILEDVPCEQLTEHPVLSDELASLGSRLSYTEGQLGSDNQEVLALKRSYMLLEIKDALLMERISAKCSLSPVMIFYFYSNEGDCPDCTKQGYVLTGLQQDLPDIRIYSFDYRLQLGALQTFIALNKVRGDLPALIMNHKTYYGLTDRDAILKAYPEIQTLLDEKKNATTTDTTTEAKSVE